MNEYAFLMEVRQKKNIGHQYDLNRVRGSGEERADKRRESPFFRNGLAIVGEKALDEAWEVGG